MITVIYKTDCSWLRYALSSLPFIRPTIAVSSANLMSGHMASEDLASNVYTVKRKGPKPSLEEHQYSR